MGGAPALALPGPARLRSVPLGSARLGTGPPVGTRKNDGHQGAAATPDLG